MQKIAETILARGLKSGYGGAGERTQVSRGPFTLTSMEQKFPDADGAYMDQWIAKRTGADQEIASAGTETATRVFAGGLISQDELSHLGTTDTEALDYLKSKLSTLADKTRLHEDVHPEADGDWLYAYRVIDRFPEIPLTIGVETITYKGTTVFVHGFLNTPVG